MLWVEDGGVHVASYAQPLIVTSFPDATSIPLSDDISRFQAEIGAGHRRRTWDWASDHKGHRRRWVHENSEEAGANVLIPLTLAGADVAITYTSKDSSELAQQLSKEFSVTVRAYKCDTANSSEVDQSVQDIKREFGKDVDIAICNAGETVFAFLRDERFLTSVF
jgi:hypothetical protein